MSEDSIGISTPFFSFSLTKKENHIKIQEGETILLRYWSWRKFGYVKKVMTLNNGVVAVTRID